MAKEDNFTLKKINNYHYEVQKEGQHTYDIYKRGSKWACSCTGYKYRGKCKHVEALAEETKEPEKLHGVYARRAQIQKSYDIWKDRYEKDPSKANEKQFKLREQQLADINKACEEEDKKPKPQRHPREEFLGVVESLEKLFEGLGKYEIVGSWRRGKDTYKDCDILTIMSPKEWKQLQERLEADPNFGPAPGRDRVDFGPEVIRGGYKNGDRVDYLDINRVPDPKEWGAWLIFRTGSQAFNIAMRGWLKGGGWKINERGLFNDKGELVARETEEEIFEAMGLPFIPPEQREDPSQFRKYFRGKPGPKEDKVEDSMVTNMTDFEDFIFDIECALEAFKTGRKQKFFMTYVVFRPQEDVSIELLIHMKPEDRKAESIKVTITEASNPDDKLIDEVIPYDEVAKRVANETRPFVNMRIDDAFKLAGKLMSMDISIFRNKRSFIGDSVQQKKESGLKYGNVAIKGIRDGKEFHAVITDKVIKSDFPFVMDQMLLQAFPGRIMDNFSKVDLSLWQKLIKA